MEDERDLEYERRRQERMRRRRLEKKRQMRRRRIMRLVAMAAVLVLVIGLVGTGIHKLISGKTGVPKEGAVEVKAQTFFKGGWKEIEGSRYYFDENGYMKTGWLELDGEDYFFDDSGKYDETKKRPMVALTFDDGPGEHTEELLDCLTKNNAKATFFMLGSNAAAFPDVVKDLKDAGMELGNHTYDHLDLTTLDSESVTSQIKRTNDAISGAAGVPATVMRPPGGAYNESVQAAIGMPLIMWSIDTKDWLTKSEDQTYQVTVDNVKDGSIVLMHDIHEWSVKAAIRVIPELVEQGYKLVTVSELAEAKGIKLENGAAHYFFGEGEQQVE